MQASGITIVIRITLFLIFPAIPAAVAMAQGSQQEIFGPAEALRKQAEAVDAALLSPSAWLDGNKDFDRARRDFNGGKNPDRVRKQLAKAGEAFLIARTNAEAAARALQTSIESRHDAQEAEAPRLAASDWNAAEKIFNAAIRAFERDNEKIASRRNDEATAQFRVAELNAIRSLILAEAWRLIAEIRQKKIHTFVPETLGLAEQLAQRANELIVEDRYALEEPTALAGSAVYEARRALYIGTAARRIKRGETTVEALILEWEMSLENIASAAKIEADLSAGPEQTSSEIVALLDQIPGLRSDLKDRDALIIDLEEEIRELDAELGGASADRSNLIRRLEQQARVREQFLQVENMFSENEAIVLREGNRLIVRLVGLNFASNSAKLGAEDDALLAKVQSAINVFPQCGLALEGHTDAQGNAARNLKLSEERAQAVKSYMTETMRIPAFRIAASGYGDTRPIASNKTEEGRARNRRIDLIISPKEFE